VQSVVFLLIALPLALADQLSKAWIITNVPEGHILFESGFFRIVHVHNTGAAFGLFQGYSLALTIIAFVAIAAVLVYVFISRRYYPWLYMPSIRIALGLVLGGVLGNLIDRLRFGYVIDFIDFSFWPAFNVADSAVTVGIVLFSVSVLMARTEKREHE
jgi:signal peptidase II